MFAKLFPKTYLRNRYRATIKRLINEITWDTELSEEEVLEKAYRIRNLGIDVAYLDEEIKKIRTLRGQQVYVGDLLERIGRDMKKPIEPHKKHAL